MYQHTSSTPSNLTFTNGNLPAPPTHFTNNTATPSDSESDLSEAIDPPSSTSAPPKPTARDNSVTSPDQRSDEGDLTSEDALGSDDGDYDIMGSPQPPQAANTSASPKSRSSSGGSRMLGKRKAGAEEDEYMLNDPELYGLRRSGRARPSRRVIESDSEDDSGSDIQSRPRKRLKSASSKPVSKQSSLSPESLSDSGSALNNSSAPRSRANGHKKLHQRRHLQVGRDLTPSQGEVRFSTRKAAKVSNYNEDDDDMFEDEEEILTPAYWATGQDENVPAIDAILNHRLRDDTGSSEVNDPGRDDFEYHVKWQGKSHIHASWETNAALTSYKGVRRLENYFRRIVQEEIRMKNDPSIPPEENEEWCLARERDADAINDYTKVERVIGMDEDQDGDIKYYVKWKGLFYDSCTWEDAESISGDAQIEIDRYLNRTSSSFQSNKTESNIHTRGRHQRILEQPSYIKHGKLREFQIHGLNFLAFHWCKGNNVILADEMGLGKTVQTIAFMNWLRHDRGQHGPFLVVVPLSTMPSWAETFDNWTPDINYVVYHGKAEARQIIRDYELLVDGNPKKTKFNVLLTTYEMAYSDAPFLSQIKWQFMAVDEAHRLKNRESQLYGKLVDFKVPSRLLITGTPLQNTLGELSSLMDFLMPGVVHIEDKMDLQSEEASRKLTELMELIRPYMLRRTKKVVESDLPSKTEKIIRMELSDIQLEYYKNILTRNYAALNEGANGQKQSLLNIMMELKKASNHPFMFPNAQERIMGDRESREDLLKSLITSSGKMMLLDQLLRKLKKDGHRVLVFSQMVKMLDLLSQYMSLRGYQYQRLDGTIAAGPRRRAIDHYNAPDSKDFCFLLSTRAGGLGINLMTADTVILFDSDWNPQADLQAMARAHRIGQTKPVMVYRLVSKETVEEEVLERARNKLMLEYVTIQRGVTDKDEKALTEKMARAGKIAEPTTSDDISRILKRRGQKMFEQSGNQKKLEELNIDAVLENAEEHHTEQQEAIAADGGEEFLKSFEYTDVKLDLEWDDIIPKDQLEQIKAEEKKKKDQEYLEEQIAQNAPRKRKAPDEARDERAAKKRARTAAASEAAAESSDQQSNEDPSRALNEREIRDLVRSYLRYGSIDDRGDELVKDARLASRERSVLKTTLNDVVSHAAQLVKQEDDRIDALERAQGKPITKKDRKAVLFNYRGVKRNNARTIMERPGEMRILRDLISKTPDQTSFRVPEASKGAEYSCEWGAREDGMLLVGILRHGHSAWTQIRDDPDLGLQDKFFLEENRVEKKEERNKGDGQVAKSPGAVHLVRRADYLLSVLKEKISNGTNLAAKRAVENHHRNNKKNGMHAAKQANGRLGSSASPAPSGIQKARKPEKQHRRDSIERRISANGQTDANSLGHGPRNSEAKRFQKSGHQRPKSKDHQRNEIVFNEQQAMFLKGLFTPIRTALNAVKSASKELLPDDTKRAKVLRVELVNIGNFIQDSLKDPLLKEDGIFEDDLWKYASQYWPNRGTKTSQIKDMYARIADLKAKEMKENSEEDGAPNGVAVKHEQTASKSG